MNKNLHIRIHVRIPSLKQIGADAVETAITAVNRVRSLVRSEEDLRAEEMPAEEAEIAQDAAGEEAETDSTRVECSAAGIAKNLLSQAGSGIMRAWNGAHNFVRDVRDDIDAICERDPAARSRMEVLCLYSGLHALMFYRVSHALHERKHYFFARFVSQYARHVTGIEIHPGATIGKGLFIDHGSGVVIGETAIVGDNCTLYQGVTLGGTGKDTGKRHPTLGNNVLVGAGAKLLGNFTIGDGAKIAAGAVVLRDVPENCTAVGIPARVVRRGGEKIHEADEMDQTHIPDPVAQQLSLIEERLARLENTGEQAPSAPAEADGAV